MAWPMRLIARPTCLDFFEIVTAKAHSIQRRVIDLLVTWLERCRGRHPEQLENFHLRRACGHAVGFVYIEVVERDLK